MAETKQYITQNQEHGTVLISEEVIATIAYNTAKDVEGVAGISAKIGDLSNIKNWVKALKITITENNEIHVDISIVVAYGQAVIVVAKAVQDAVTGAIESTTGIKPSVVNVNVCGISAQ